MREREDLRDIANPPEATAGAPLNRASLWETLEYGVVKMNIDTDTQYAFTRPIAGHIMKNYDGVLKVDGEVGVKKTYDPRTYLKLAEASMAERVKVGAEDLLSAGNTLFKG